MYSELKIYQAIAVAERFGTVSLGKKVYTAAELRTKVKPMYPLPPFNNSRAYAPKPQEESIETMFTNLLKRMEREKRKH